MPMREFTQIANAARAHLGELGVVAAKGVHNIGRPLEAGDAPTSKPFPNQLEDQ